MKNIFHIYSLIALALLIFIGGCQSKSDLEIAQASLDIGDYDRARKLYDQVLNSEPENSSARYGLALSWYNEASDQEIETKQKFILLKNAHKEFSILAKTDSSINTNSWHSLTLYQLAQITLSKDPNQCITLLNQSLEKDPENIFSLNLKAIISKELGNEKLASQLWNKITLINPNFENAWISLGQYHFDTNDFENAYITWQLGLEQNPHSTQLQQFVLKVSNILGL